MQSQTISAADTALTPSFFSAEILQQDPALRHHSLRQMLPVSIDIATVQQRFASLNDMFRAQRLKVSFWHEPLAFGSDEPPTIALLEKESLRALAPGHAARLLLLTSPDGNATLIVSACRQQLDYYTLYAIASYVADGEPFDFQQAVATVPDSDAPPVQPQSVSWGKGHSGERGMTGRLKLHPQNIPLETIIAATGFLLTHYGMENPYIAVLQSPRHAPTVFSCLPFSADVTDPLAAFQANARQLAPCSFKVSALPAVGIIKVQSSTTMHYTPCYAPLFPLTFVWSEDEDRRLHGELLFDRGVINGEVAEQFVALLMQFLQSSESCAAETPAADLVRLDEQAQRRILSLGDNNKGHRAAATTITDALLAQVNLQPDSPAVSDDRQTLSYRELNARADALAVALRHFGISRGDRVGVCLERNVELVVTLLAVMKAGAAYVPMDARYPEERLIHTVTDAGLRLVLSDAASFPSITGVALCNPAEMADGATESIVSDQPTADDIAYVIYTSGSTGKPKGVAVPHKNVGVLVSATQQSMALGANDTWTLFHSSAFDFSVWEIWGCLLTGGHLLVLSYWTTRSPEECYQLLVEKQVTVLNQTPSAFAALDAVDRRMAAKLALRLVIFGGEALNVKTLAGWTRRHPLTHCKLINMFGITETTVHVTQQVISQGMIKAGDKSVGRALPGWSISVRDPQGAVQPCGIQGEIWVGGNALASHYLNQPDLTGARFVTDTLSGERLYRSGDLGRLCADGRLEHLGRIDSQVKVRGFRIELEEIRTVLLNAPQVNAAAVLLNQPDKGDNASVTIEAYVVLKAGCSTEALRSHAARFLPDYMLPSCFIAVPAIPLTANGKLDAAQLKSLKRDEPLAAAEADEQPAQGNVLLSIWQEVIGSPVAADEDFFESGGNSLLAVQLCSTLRERGLGHITLRDLYIHSTPDALQAHLQQ